MPKEKLLPATPPEVDYPDRIVAIVVGIEDYQDTPTGPALPKVDFARNDAVGFARALKSIYPSDRIDLQEFTDSQATASSLDYALKQTIEALAPDNLFVFYYAGHGFHGVDGNRITAWDSRPFNIEGSTILLREKLSERLAASGCQRALAFVDACATKFEPLVRARDVVSDMDPGELKEFLSSATYNAIFLSCRPGQQSYPSPEHAHGVWTYFLLRALSGDAETAIGPGRYITAASLQDYLQKEVPRYVTNRLNVKGNQNPRAIIDQSNTFQIRYVPEPTVPLAEAGDLSQVRVVPLEEYLEGKEGGRLRSLEGFGKRKRKIFPDVTSKTDDYWRELIAPRIDQEIADLYRDGKKVLKLPADDLTPESEGGDGNLDCAHFRFSIEGHQDPDQADQYVIVRKLELRDGWEEHEAEIDNVFGSIFENAVVEMDPKDLKFDALVKFFEGVERAHGGSLDDDRRSQRITYTAKDGTRIVIDAGEGRLAISGRHSRTCSQLVDLTRQYRFTLNGPSRLLLSST